VTASLKLAANHRGRFKFVQQSHVFSG